LELFKAQTNFVNKVRALGPALLISVDRSGAAGRGLGGNRLVDPESSGQPGGGSGMPLMTVFDPRLVKVLDALKADDTSARLTVRWAAPDERPVQLRNVAGILRGSDRALADTYVIVSAHYDHLGARSPAGGDSIFNGANDDGSGTVSVMELASALATLKQRPKRSIVFIAWFGEEKGLLGSRYYARHPLFPIEKTVAMVNFEQLGRTDSTEGPQLNNATLTGFDYSDMGSIFKAAGEKTGISVYKHEKNSDGYFGASDNQAMADQGVPAHTLCVAFNYSDYHGAGDHWEKVDYDNMAKVDRMAALAVWMIADNTEAPKWNESNPKTERYVKSWKARHGQ
jgi:Zn-dependent M28 family amino/carboxypeptidase